MSTNDNLLIRIYSFSYRNSEPIPDPTGNGGGFVFDCRALPNPHGDEKLRPLTGLDAPVIKMLSDSEKVTQFVNDAHRMVVTSAQSYQAMGYTNLSVMFGCTGGRHRSVYCADLLTDRLKKDGFECRVIHWQLELKTEKFTVRRGMILAAGLGTRLKSLTEHTPKALIEVGGKTMLDWTLERMTKVECSEVVVNAHHHADQIESWRRQDFCSRGCLNHDVGFDESSPYRVIISKEDEILGTGGGIAKAARWLHGSTPVLVHNGDVWHDFDLEKLYAAHKPDDMATLVCQKRESTSYLLVDDENRICGLSGRNGNRKVAEPIGQVRNLGFAGIHLCSYRLIEQLHKSNRSSIRDTYLDLTEQGETVRIVELEGNWFDMGSSEKLQRLREFLK